MRRKVYTYRSIAALDEHPCFNELQKTPHVTATAALCAAMKQKWPQIDNCVDIHDLQKGMIAKWEDADTAFQQFINISKVIRSLQVGEEEHTIHGSFIKNKVQVLNAIRLLTEAEVHPEDICSCNIEEVLFKRIWEAMCVEDESFAELKAMLAAYMEDPRKFEAMINEVAPCLAADTIIMHGFYFITPIQERIFDMLEKCGKQLVFLCCMDEDVSEAGEIWERVLDTDNNFESKEHWIADKKIPMRNKAFGSIFGNAPRFDKMNHVSLIKYDSELDFVRDVERIRGQGMHIFSTDVKATDELLKDFYPDVYKRKHLLSYPVGQYIYRLHSMWDAKEQCLALSLDDIQACFASGWVAIEGVNAIDHMQGLESLSTYVSDCRTIDEWEARLALLQETKRDVLAAFEEHIQDMPPHNRRWHRMMADPFKNLSCFDYNEADLQEMIDMIRHLIETAKVLFADPSEISISTHLSKLRQLLEEGKREEDLLEEERAIVNELISRLQKPNVGVRKCLPGEISEAIMLLIGGGILDEDNYSIQSGHDHTFIKPLYQVEGAPILSNGKIHLCFADEGRMPGSPKSYVWPLNDDMLDRVKVSEDERRYRYLRDMRGIIDNAPIANRYLFYSLLQNKDVEISWIATAEKKEIAASPYVQVLNKMFDVTISSPEKSIWTTKDIKCIESANVDMMLNAGSSERMPLEVRLDGVLCPRRYLYGYILSDHPAFSSDFHYNFALANLIGTVAAVAGIPQKEAADNVLELFPYLRDVEKQQIIDNILSDYSENTDTMDDVSYPHSRLMIHFLRKSIMDKAEEMYIRYLEEEDKRMSVDTACDAEISMYCPYNHVCPMVMHAK